MKDKKGMSSFDIFCVLLILVIMTVMIRDNSLKLDDVEKKIDIILENQKLSVVTPTPQKDVE